MCGIAGVHRLSEARVPKIDQLADELMYGIINRGYDAAGYLAVREDGRRQLEKMVGRADKVLIPKRKRIPADTQTLLLHTRWATKGDKKDPRNAHPVSHGKTTAIHNGTIYNDQDIFRAFDLKRNAAVDSVAIPAIIDHAGWDRAEDAVTLLTGGAACAVVNDDAPGELLLFAFGNWPIVYGHDGDMLVWASTHKAIMEAWENLYGCRPPFDLRMLPNEYAFRANGKVEDLVKLDMPKWSSPKPKKAATKKPTKAKKKKTQDAPPAEELQADGVIIWNGGRWYGELTYLGPADEGEEDTATIEWDGGGWVAEEDNPTGLSDEAWNGLLWEVVDFMEEGMAETEIRELLRADCLFEDEIESAIAAARQVSAAPDREEAA